MGRAGRDILQSGCRHCRSQNILELAKNELYYHTDNHGCPRMTRRIILSHGQSRMPTDDTENYIITRTITDVYWRHGEYYHMYNRGCPRTIRRIYIITRTITVVHWRHGELLCDSCFASYMSVLRFVIFLLYGTIQVISRPCEILFLWILNNWWKISVNFAFIMWKGILKFLFLYPTPYEMIQ